MTNKSNAYATVIADLKRQRNEIDRMIVRLEAMASDMPPPVDQNSAATASPAGPAGSLEASPATENDPYLGMSICDAVKVILTAKREPMSPAEIVTELENGGLVLSGENNNNTVNSVLHRRQRQKGDIVNPKRGQWGLREWYPGRTFGKNKKTESNGGDVRQKTLTETSEHKQPSEQPHGVHPHSND